MNRSAVARPRPLVPPVMIAIFPSSLAGIVVLSLGSFLKPDLNEARR
jgi:hypothetical protein